MKQDKEFVLLSHAQDPGIHVLGPQGPQEGHPSALCSELPVRVVPPPLWRKAGSSHPRTPTTGAHRTQCFSRHSWDAVGPSRGTGIRASGHREWGEQLAQGWHAVSTQAGRCKI